MRTLWFTSDDKFLDAVFTDEIGRVIYTFPLTCLAPWAADHKHCTAGCRHFSSFKDRSVRELGGNWICICNALTGEHRVLGTAAKGRVLGGKGMARECIIQILTEEV